MKKFILLFAGILILASCSNEEVFIEETVQDTQSFLRTASPNIRVCHKNSNEIVLDEAGLEAHIAHGDAVDRDGDGFYDRTNPCSDAVDCDDDNANIYPGAIEVCDNSLDDNCDGNIDEGCIPSVGDFYQGGVVFYLDENEQHGLIAAENNQSEGTDYNNAINLISELELNGYSDWYLPAMDELFVMINNRQALNFANFGNGVYMASRYNNSSSPGGLIETSTCGKIKIYNSTINGDVFIANINICGNIALTSSSSNVLVNSDVGGLVGNYDITNSTIENSYPTGTVTPTDWDCYSGGLIGQSQFNCTFSISTNYYEGDTNGLKVRAVRTFSID